jgi:hypothetical protein
MSASIGYLIGGCCGRSRAAGASLNGKSAARAVISALWIQSLAPSAPYRDLRKEFTAGRDLMQSDGEEPAGAT